MNIVKVADWTFYPGPATREYGPNSGQEFLESLLEPAFQKALATNVMMLVDLDGVNGYAYSFMRAAFGGLALKYGSQAVHDHLLYKSEEEPYLEEELREIVWSEVFRE